MLRFTSTPTRDMHIGDLRDALFNYIVSQKKGEDFIVRIEDTNKKRNIDGKDKEILDLLDLFGIRYTQTIYQSESARFHAAMALQLMHEKKAFSCFCSWEWIQKKKEEAKANKQEYKYDDACANLPAELVIDNLNPFTIRIHKPTKDIMIKEYFRGEITFKPEDIESFMIMKQDKTATYEFATAVDDMLNDISFIIRSEEHSQNASKEEYIRASLEYNKQIEYVHLANFPNEESLSIKSLLEQGFLPEAISNYLISTIYKAPKEIFTLGEVKEWFALENLISQSHSFDLKKLAQINNKHLRLLDSKELSRYVGFADEEIGLLAKVYLEEVSTTKELKAKIEPIFAPKKIPQEFIKSSTLIVDVVKSAPYFEEYDDFVNYIMRESGLEGENFFTSLSFVLTGAKDGVELCEIYKYLKNYIGEIVK